jgi:hypothetical protein
LSKNSADSPHVLREVERGSSKRHPLVSFRIDVAPLPSGLEYFLNTSHWLDASATGVENALPKVVAAVRHLVGSAATAGPAHEIPAKRNAELPARPVATTNRSLSPTLMVLAAMVLAAVGYFVADRIWLSKKAATAVAQAPAPATPSPTSAATAQVAGGKAAFAPPAHSIAVLPFVNMSGDRSRTISPTVSPRNCSILS